MLKEQRVNFYVFAVQNIGERTAENVKAFIHTEEADLFSDLRELKHVHFVQPSGIHGQPMGIDWDVSKYGSMDDVLAIARALTDQLGKEETTLNPSKSNEEPGIAEIFSLVLTFEDSNIIIFPSKMHREVVSHIPATGVIIYVELEFQAKDTPTTMPIKYRIDAKAWNDVTVTKLDPKFKLPSPQFSRAS